MIEGEYIRKIIHVDMDAFYASIEQRDRPELNDKPVAVGGSRQRGVVAAASYEARRYGVYSAMPSSLAKRKCPDLIFIEPDFKKYKMVSAQIKQIFYEYTDLVEPLSLDEAYLDVTTNKAGIPTATKIAREIRKRIYSTTELTASAGISMNKFLAKVASDINKPNGQKTIMPEEALEFMERLPIHKFYGIGAKTAEKMKNLGIHFGKDLKSWGLDLLVREFGKSGIFYYNIIRGIQKSTVQPHRARKSVSAESTFQRDLYGLTEMEKELSKISANLEQRIQRSDCRGHTLTLKIKYQDFEQQTRSRTVENILQKKDHILALALELLRQKPVEKPVRLLGLGISNLITDEEEKVQQLTLEF